MREGSICFPFTALLSMVLWGEATLAQVRPIESVGRAVQVQEAAGRPSPQVETPPATSLAPITAGSASKHLEECNVLGVVVTAKGATITRKRPGMEPGELFSAGGKFREKPVDVPCDPGLELGPFPVTTGGKLVARLKGDPPAPNRMSLGNAGTSLRIVFEPDLGDGHYGPAQTVVSFKIPAEKTDAEMEGTWSGPGRLRAYTGAPGGGGPLTSVCYAQSYTAIAEIVEVAASGPVHPGMRLYEGDRITTERGGRVVIQGSTNVIGGDSEVDIWGYGGQDAIYGPEVQIKEGPADLAKNQSPDYFDKNVDQLAVQLRELELAGYLQPTNTHLVDYGAPFPGVDSESIAAEALDFVANTKDPCVAALELKLFLDASPQGFLKKSADMAVDVSAIWLLPNDWDVMESWGKALFSKMPGLGLVSNSQIAIDTWNRVRQEFVPTVASEKGNWTLDAYRRYKQGRWTLQEIEAEQKRLQAAADQARMKAEELQATFDAEVIKREAALKQELADLRGDTAAKIRSLDVNIERIMRNTPNHPDISKNRLELISNYGQRAKAALSFLQIEVKKKLHARRMNELGQEYQAAVTAQLLEIARLRTETQALEAYAKPLAANDCPSIKPLKSKTAAPCTARKAAAIAIKKGTVHIMESQFGPFGKAVGQTSNRYLHRTPMPKVQFQVEDVIYRPKPNGTEYSVEKIGDTAMVRVFDGEVDIISTSGNPLTVKAGQQVAFPAGTINSLDASQSPSALVDGIPLNAFPVDSHVAEPYGTQEFSAADGRLPAGWVWQEPNSSLSGPGDATLDVVDASTLRITTPNENEFWGHRCDAPRLIHKVTGDFDLEASLFQECAGLNHAFSQFIVFTPTSPLGYLQKQMRPEGIKSNYFIVGGGWNRFQNLNKLHIVNRKIQDDPDAPDHPIRTRMSRRGDQLKTYTSLDDGETWTISDRYDLTLPDTIWVGWVFKRMAVDGLRGEPAITPLSDIRLTSAPLGTMQQLEWDVINQHGTVSASGNEIFMLADGSSPGAVQAFSPWPIAGDFDLIARFDAPPVAPLAEEVRYIHVAVASNDDKDHAYIRHVATEGGQRYDSDMSIKGNWYRYHKQETSDTSGRLRMTRTAGQVSSFFWRDGGWIPVAEWKDDFAGPLYLDFRFQWNTKEPLAQTAHFTLERLQTEQGLLIGESAVGTASHEAPFESSPPTTGGKVVSDPPEETTRKAEPSKNTPPKATSENTTPRDAIADAGMQPFGSKPVTNSNALPLASRIGIQGRSLTLDERQLLGLPGGIHVTDILENSVAKRLDINPGDVIVRLGDQEVTTSEQLNQLLLAASQSGELNVSLGLLRASRGVNLQATLPLPLNNHQYKNPSGHYSLQVPQGWFLIPHRRNNVADEAFDTLMSPSADQVMIIARNGISLRNPVVELTEYQRQEMVGARRYSDAKAETFSIMSAPAFRISYRSPQQRTAVSRIAFVYSKARFVINVVTYNVDDTNLSSAVTEVLASIQPTKHTANTRPVSRQSIFGKHQRPPLIGIWAISAGTPEAVRLGIESPVGAVLKQVQAGSPADTAGLRAGDKIVQYGNREINNYEDFECALLSVPVGSQQKVIFVRGNSRLQTTLTLGEGPIGRQTYVDFRHKTNGYTLRLPKSWKITRTTELQETNANAHDLITSRDGNYQLHCYIRSKPAANAGQTLTTTEGIMRRDLGDRAVIQRPENLPVPMSVAGLTYQAESNRTVVLYRIAMVIENRLYVIDCFAPVLSDTKRLTDVLQTIFSTIKHS